jgi:hypothetical protein
VSRLVAGLSFAWAVACSPDQHTKGPAVSYGDCDGRAETIAAGSSKLSKGGYRFELTRLEPAVPVQSGGAPGNHWTVTISDPSGAPATGTLAIATFMPDHEHAGSPAAAVEIEPGSGIYDVSELIFSMPTLFVVTLTLTPESGPAESVQLMLCMDVASG